MVAAVEGCAQRGVKALVITTSGFAEADNGGAGLQLELVRIAKSVGVRIMGPNTSGITSTPHSSPASIFPLGKLKRGPVSVIAQTGDFAAHTVKWMQTGDNLGVCRVVGLGNKVDVEELDLLEYFGNDSETKAIAMYLEGFKNARRFLEIAKRVCLAKPLIALKAGRTSSGIRAVASHTASLASNDSIVDAALRQAGIVRVLSYAGLIDTIKLLNHRAAGLSLLGTQAPVIERKPLASQPRRTFSFRWGRTSLQGRRQLCLPSPRR